MNFERVRKRNKLNTIFQEPKGLSSYASSSYPCHYTPPAHPCALYSCFVVCVNVYFYFELCYVGSEWAQQEGDGTGMRGRYTSFAK